MLLFHIWKEQEKLNEIHILFVQIGFEFTKLLMFEILGLICDSLKILGA